MALVSFKRELTIKKHEISSADNIKRSPCGYNNDMSYRHKMTSGGANMNSVITLQKMEGFRDFLIRDEKSVATVSKYMHDIKCFVSFLEGTALSKEKTLEYKCMLERRYATASANSMLAAMNAFLRFLGMDHCCVKSFRVQRKVYSSEKEELTQKEYNRLVWAAKRKGDYRMALILQTICGTGIRVSELPYITVEAVKKGEAVVSCKGKIRVVFIIPALRQKLLAYARKIGVQRGEIFVTKTGKSMHRSNIWREMKLLCTEATVSPDKVFPHNLRHLFARCYYKIVKDIAKLADVLGHSNINTTRIYIMTTGIEHRREMEMLRLII